VRTRRTLWLLLAATLVATLLAGCGFWEHAEVTIAYAAASRANEKRLDTLGPKTVENAFSVFSKANGYACRSHIKRVRELRCSGPRQLHLVFAPSLNKPAFVAEFSWANLSGRTHAEFISHVARFKDEMGSMIGEQNVRVEPGN
jgi:hypothetical protein